jgi:YggT family protein
VNDVLYWIGVALYLYGFVLLARFVMSWILALTQFRPSGAVAVLFELVYTVTDPPLKLLRRWIPPLNMGRVSLDVSFIVLALGISIVARVLMQG